MRSRPSDRRRSHVSRSHVSRPKVSRPRSGGNGRSASVATVLSFLWPGLGQRYAGRPRAALRFALPIAVLAVVALLTIVFALGLLATLILQPISALALVAILVLVGVWRIVAMHDAMAGLTSPEPEARQRAKTIFAVLAVVVVISHGWLAYATWTFHDAGQRVFVGDGPSGTARPSLAPGAVPPALDDYEVPPFATPPTSSSRVNILLIGVDSAENRDTMLTDTLMVVSVSPETGSTAMVSFPRDLADFTMSNGAVYKGKINSLMAFARRDPDRFPEGPLGTLAKELGYLLGVPIHYVAAIDLDGFRRMIDVAGGVTVDNPKAIDDPTYAWADGRRGFTLSAGLHHLDGQTATAFVRTRKTAGDTDFDRSRRQQQLLLALRSQVVRPESLPRIPDLTQAAGDTIRTNFPSDRIGEFLDLARSSEGLDPETVVLGPPYALRAAGTADYRLHFDMDRLARKSVELFGSDSRYATP